MSARPDIETLAGVLDAAVRDAEAVPQLSTAHVFDLDAAYRIQAAGITLRTARGEAVVGAKLGFTSKAKAEQMGVSDVIAGVLTSGMLIEDGGAVDRGALIHPRIEPEVAFRLGAAIDPADADADPWDCVDAVAPAMEIIDSRYRDFRFSLADVVADNTSAAGFVVGPWRPVGGIDLGDLAVVLAVDGEPAETGTTAAILGDPVRAIAAVTRMARHYDIALPAGAIVLAGAATAAVPLPDRAGASVTAMIAGLGEVGVRVVGTTEASDA